MTIEKEEASTTTSTTPNLPKEVLENYDYQGNDNYKKPRLDYVRKVFAMTKDELFKATENMIWMSAYAANNRRSDYHWQCTACYDACKQFPGLYDKAYKSAKKSAGC